MESFLIPQSVVTLEFDPKDIYFICFKFFIN